MRSKRSKILLLFIISLTLGSCDKDRVDFRDAYTGDWEFYVIRRVWNISWEDTYGYVSIWDTTTHNGSIEYGSGDSSLMVNFIPNWEVETGIEMDGKKYYIYGDVFDGFSIFYGTDSLYLWVLTKALGDGEEYKVRGKKL